jgi:hypothetical protein
MAVVLVVVTARRGGPSDAARDTLEGKQLKIIAPADRRRVRRVPDQRGQAGRRVVENLGIGTLALRALVVPRVLGVRRRTADGSQPPVRSTV